MLPLEASSDLPEELWILCISTPSRGSSAVILLVGLGNFMRMQYDDGTLSPRYTH